MLKSKIVRLIEKRTDKFEAWDTDRKYPKIEKTWEERIADSAWHAYNDTYGPDISPGIGSYAEFCEHNHDGDPGFLYLVTGDLLETSDSTIDRMCCDINSTYPVGHVVNRNPDADRNYFIEETEANTVAGRKMSELYDSVTKPGQVASTVFVDIHNPNRHFEFTVIGSADFFDLNDETKEFMTEKWYRRWYNENKRRGLVDFEYSFPKKHVKSNREVYGSNDLDKALAAYEARLDKKLSFKAWLQAPYAGA